MAHAPRPTATCAAQRAASTPTLQQNKRRGASGPPIGGAAYDHVQELFSIVRKRWRRGRGLQITNRSRRHPKERDLIDTPHSEGQGILRLAVLRNECIHPS